MECTVEKCVTEFTTKLLEAPFLQYPINNNPFILNKNALLAGVGKTFTQKQGVKDEVITYSRQFLSKV